jgi:hypothetical protein
MAKVFPDGWRDRYQERTPVGPVAGLLQQKAGLLSETPGGLAKKYAGKENNVPSQWARRTCMATLPLIFLRRSNVPGVNCAE